MTFDETLKLLSWAKANRAADIKIEGGIQGHGASVSCSFFPDAPARDLPTPMGLSPHETRKRLDQDMFGLDLDTLVKE